MGTTAIEGILRAMTQRVQRQQELIDQLRLALETQNLENLALARELSVVIDEFSRSNVRAITNRWDSLEAAEAFENTDEQVESRSRLFRIGVQTEERNES